MQIACVIVGQTPRCVNDSRVLEERLFTPNTSAKKPQAHGNGAGNELGVSLVKDISEKERETDMQGERDRERERHRRRARCNCYLPY